MSEVVATPRRRGRPPKNRTLDVGDNQVKIEAATTPRPPIRPEMKPDDPRLLAEKRAAEIMGHLNGDLDIESNEFVAPPPPEGWTYEWKRRTVYNQEDPAYQVQLARMGWEPVPLDRYPDMMPMGHGGNTIERKGQVLMMRPAVITEKVREQERRKANLQVRVKEEQLAQTPDGTLSRDADPRVKPRVNKSYEAIQIPEE